MDLDILCVANDRLMLGRVVLYQAILRGQVLMKAASAEPFRTARRYLDGAVDGFREAGQQDYIPRGLLFRAWSRFLDGDATGARADLDEAWDIAERGPMRLHMADIHLYRARLFFSEKHYPWKSPQDDLATAEKLINNCGYHRRDEELADAKKVILGQ